MGIKFGEIDSGQILENEYRIKVLERLVEWLMNNNSQLNKPDLRQMEAIRNDVVRELQVKYPQSGIKRMG